MFDSEFLKVGHIDRSQFQDFLIIIWSYVIYSSMLLNLVKRDLVKGNEAQI